AEEQKKSKHASLGICLQAPFVVMITGRQTDTGTGGDVVFLLSPRVMSFPHSDSAHTVVAALSIHCHHSDCSTPTHFSSAGNQQPAIGQCVTVVEPQSNGRGGE
ncbi:hypothetical protein ILYODFUR_027178, partial [Ilyodon furcidens]